MKIQKESNFKPAAEGLYDAVCVDVVDLGIVTSKFGDKHKLKIVWEVNQKMDNGGNFTVQQRYTASLGQKSNLRKDLKAWRGKDFTAEELKVFDMEKLIGACCQIVIKHNENEGNVYANVATILTAKNQMTASGKYTRAKDREDYVAPNAQTGVQEDEDDAGDLAPTKSGNPF